MYKLVVNGAQDNMQQRVRYAPDTDDFEQARDEKKLEEQEIITATERQPCARARTCTSLSF